MQNILLVFSIFTSTLASAHVLAGKSFRFEYPEAHYEVGFSEKTVTWRGIQGADINKMEIDLVEVMQISSNNFFVQWKEFSGSFVTLMINLETNEVFSSGTSPEGNWLMKGKVLNTCVLDSATTQELMNLDYQKFDQDMNGGWRSYALQGCYETVAKLIDEYHSKHPALLDWQHRVLNWHAGQMYAFADDYALAIQRLTKARISNEPTNDPFKWNAYADASIAFLEGDQLKLKTKRDELVTATDAGSKNNLSAVDRLIKCFDSPYSQAYSGLCSH